MARLYWRVKKNGKWTWRSAVDVGKDEAGFIIVIPYEGLEYCNSVEDDS